MTAEQQGLLSDIWPGGEKLILATLRRCHDAYSRRDFDETARGFHQEIELVPAGGQPVIRGLPAVRAWMEPDAFAEQVLDLIDVWVAGNTALVRVHARARGAASEIELEFDAWSVWTFNAYGLATRAEIYMAHQEAEARRAAGLNGDAPLHWSRAEW